MKSHWKTWNWQNGSIHLNNISNKYGNLLVSILSRRKQDIQKQDCKRFFCTLKIILLYINIAFLFVSLFVIFKKNFKTAEPNRPLFCAANSTNQEWWLVGRDWKTLPGKKYDFFILIIHQNFWFYNNEIKWRLERQHWNAELCIEVGRKTTLKPSTLKCQNA